MAPFYRYQSGSIKHPSMCLSVCLICPSSKTVDFRTRTGDGSAVVWLSEVAKHPRGRDTYVVSISKTKRDTAVLSNKCA